LEDRRLLAGFTVNSLGDQSDGDLADGICDTGNAQNGFTGLRTLRAALENAELTAALDTISFQLSGTINVNSFLPLAALRAPVTIDGQEQIRLEGSENDYPAFWLLKGSAGGPGSAGSTIKGLAITGFSWGILAETGNHVIEDNSIGTNFQGASGLGNGRGIELSGSGGNLVRNNIISGNQGYGVILDGSSGNRIEDNFIGTKAGGFDPLGNGHTGISIVGSANKVVRNVIAANNGPGIEISGFGSNADDNEVLDNAIGTDQARSKAMGNAGRGIGIFDASNTVVRGNTISANGSGIDIGSTSGSGSTVTSNVVQGNFIGTDGAGTTTTDVNGASLGNKFSGITIFGGFENTIGGTTDAERNVISGNEQSGIELYTGTRKNKIQGNRIGTDVTGTQALGNGYAGVRVVGGIENEIGGTAEKAGNVISGNEVGVVISGVAGPATGNLVQGNRIGTDITGESALPNRSGVVISDGATQNTVGGTQAGAGNVISGNRGDGIQILGVVNATRDNLIQGNFIGTNATGATALPNASAGGGSALSIIGASENTIGGVAAGASSSIATGVGSVSRSGTAYPGNLIVGSGGVLILGFVGSPVTANKVQGNFIGTDATGTSSFPVDFGGVSLQNAADTLLGGVEKGAGNLIAGSGSGGVAIQGEDSTGNRVQGNYIGADITGKVAFPNSNGVSLANASDNVIGGTEDGAGNLISGNTFCGVQIMGQGATDNRVEGNRIGTDISGDEDLSNGSDGVYIGLDATDNTIGGTVNEAGNSIAFNEGNGVTVESGTGNAIRRNRIFANGSLGIDLGNDGVTANDVRDTDSGANGLQNFPSLSRVNGTNYVTLVAVPGQTFELEFFLISPTEATYLKTETVSTDDISGTYFSKSILLPNTSSTVEFISVTATESSSHNTSELLPVIKDVALLAVPHQDPPQLTTTQLVPALQTALAAFQALLRDESGNQGLVLPISSAVRPADYQAHFYELRTKFLELRSHGVQSSPNSTRPHLTLAPDYADLIDDVNSEIDRHQLVAKTDGSPAVNAPFTSRHETGEAVDFDLASLQTSTGLSLARIIELANQAGLIRLPNPADDPPHFQLSNTTSEQSAEIVGNSPVNILVVDPLGRRIGYDPTTGATVNEFGADVEYSGPGSEPQIIEFGFGTLIPGDYLITGIGTGFGPYRIIIKLGTEDNPSSVATIVATGIAAPGQPIDSVDPIDPFIFVSNAIPSVSITGGTFVYDGQPHPATGSVIGIHGEELGAPTFTYNGSSEVPLNAGTYDVVALFPGNADYAPASATATLTITAVALAVSLGPDNTAENAGLAAVTGTVTRSTADLSQALVVTLASSDTTEAGVPATVTIPAGQASATFAVDAVDDALLDGTQAVTITATADGFPEGSADLQVADHETLTVSLAPTSIAENAGLGAVTGTVTRSNTADLSQALVVNLASSDTTEAGMPATVTIPAGQASATFAVDAVDDAILDGIQSVSIAAHDSAAAARYLIVAGTLEVTDVEFAVIRSLSYWKSHLSAWPVSNLSLGGYKYNRKQLLAILKAAKSSDARVANAQKLIVAKLNLAAGCDPALLQPTINKLDRRLARKGKITIKR